MTKMSQKEAVYQAVCNVVKQSGGKVSDGEKVNLTSEQRKSVNAILFEGFQSGTIQLETSFDSESDLRSYVSGLQSNWLRKDKRLNGGITYTPKNPGSRVGQGDAQLKALKQLMSTVKSPNERAEIQRHIDAREAEIAEAKKPKIDFAALPKELARKYA